MQFESKDSGDVAQGGLHGLDVGVGHEEEVGESGSEIRSIDVYSRARE